MCLACETNANRSINEIWLHVCVYVTYQMTQKPIPILGRVVFWTHSPTLNYKSTSVVYKTTQQKQISIERLSPPSSISHTHTHFPPICRCFDWELVCAEQNSFSFCNRTNNINRLLTILMMWQKTCLQRDVDDACTYLILSIAYLWSR